MLGLADIRNYLKTLDTKVDLNNYYIGKLDNKKDKSIGVYQRKINNNPLIALGGNLMSYKILPVSILVHYNKNARETEEFSNKLYLELLNKSINLDDLRINNRKIKLIKLYNSSSVDVGADDNNVYERVIELDFYYE